MKNYITIKFLEDLDDSYPAIEAKGFYLSHIPSVGECIYLNGHYHRIKDIAHDVDHDSVCLHLGQSAQSAEETRSKGYGLWNS